MLIPGPPHIALAASCKSLPCPQLPARNERAFATYTPSHRQIAMGAMLLTLMGNLFVFGSMVAYAILFQEDSQW